MLNFLLQFSIILLYCLFSLLSVLLYILGVQRGKAYERRSIVPVWEEILGVATNLLARKDYVGLVNFFDELIDKESTIKPKDVLKGVRAQPTFPGNRNIFTSAKDKDHE